MSKNIGGYFGPGWGKRFRDKYGRRFASAVGTGLKFMADGTPQARLQTALRRLQRNKRRSRYQKGRKINWTPYKSSVAMYRAPYQSSFKNYPLKKASTRQHVVRGSSTASVSVHSASSSHIQPAGINLWTSSLEPIKNQGVTDDMVRVGDSYNITSQVMRICMEGGTTAEGKQKGFCTRLIILEMDYTDYDEYIGHNTDFNWVNLMDHGGQSYPEITTWFNNSTVTGKVLPKYKIMYDKSFKIGTDGSNIEERDLTIRFPRRQNTHDRNNNLNTDRPIKGKFYILLWVHDGLITDNGPTIKWSVRTSIRD